MDATTHHRAQLHFERFLRGTGELVRTSSQPTHGQPNRTADSRVKADEVEPLGDALTLLTGLARSVRLMSGWSAQHGVMAGTTD